RQLRPDCSNPPRAREALDGRSATEVKEGCNEFPCCPRQFSIVVTAQPPVCRPPPTFDGRSVVLAGWTEMKQSRSKRHRRRPASVNWCCARLLKYAASFFTAAHVRLRTSPSRSAGAPSCGPTPR